MSVSPNDLHLPFPAVHANCSVLLSEVFAVMRRKTCEDILSVEVVADSIYFSMHDQEPLTLAAGVDNHSAIRLVRKK